MENHERAAALKALLGCVDQSAQALSDAMTPKAYASKTVLYHQGDLNDNLWLVLSGTVQLQTVSVEGQATIIASFGPGEMVGAFPHENEVGFDALSTDRAQTLQIGAPTLASLIREYPDLGGGLAAIFAGQLDSVLDRLSARVSLSATGRFHAELLRAADPDGIIAPPPVIAALALMAQTTRETGSRAVSKLEERGILERDKDRMTILSPRMLEQLVI